MSSPKNQSVPEALTNVDAWENVLTGIGTADRDKRTAGRAIKPAANTDFRTWETLYESDDVARRIAEVFPREMTREWISFKIDDRDSNGARTEEDVETRAATADDVMSALDDLNAQQASFSALVWGRVFGGGLIFMGIDDGGGSDPEALAQPLNEDRIKSFGFLTVFDRHEVQVVEWYDNPFEEKFGQPKVYQIISSSVPGGSSIPTARVHETRFLKFDGVHTSRRRRVENWGWGDSVFTAMCEIIRDFGQSWAGVAALLADFAQGVWKVKGLADALKSDESLVYNRIRIMNLCRSILRTVPLDAELEEFTRQQTPISGLPETMDRLAERLAMAAELPLTVLMGRSPAGQNSTGESDIRLFYDRIAARQEDKLRAQLERMITLLLKSKDGPTNGNDLDGNWTMTFNALWQLSDDEEAERRLNIAKADEIYVNMGAVSPMDVTKSRFGSGEFNPEMMVDISEAQERETAAKAAAEAGIAALAAAGDDPPEDPDDPEREDSVHRRRDQVAPVDGTNEPIDHVHADPLGGLTGGLTELTGADAGMHTHERPDSRGTTEPAQTGKDHVHTTDDGNTGLDFPVFRQDQAETPAFCKLDSPSYDAARCRAWKTRQANKAEK